MDMFKGEDTARGLEDKAMGSRLSGDATLARVLSGVLKWRSE